MNPSGPVEPEEFVENGEIRMAKLVSTSLGAVWLTVAAGWITVVQAVTLVHIRILDAIAELYVRVIDAVGGGGAETLRVSWASAFEAAVDANPMLAPAIFSVEIVAVSALLLYTRRRWF